MLSTLLGLLALAAPVHPSVPAGFDLYGFVRDSAGNPLVGARVVVVETNRATATDAEGRYHFSDLASGSWNVSFAMVGFAPAVRRITITDRSVSLDVTLRQSVLELPPIQVTSTPIATTALESPQPTSVLSDDQLRAAQSASLGETLSGVAGVHNLSTGTGVGKPVIRGLTSNRVLILDNGQRLENQQWGDEHGPNVETSNADRVEVIRGPASVLYGSDALGGVINVVENPLPDALGRAAFTHGRVGFRYGTNNREPDAAAMVEGASGGFGYRLEGSGRTSDDVRTPDYTLWNSGNRAIGGSGTLGYRGGWGSVAGAFTMRDERVELTDEDPLETPLQRVKAQRARVTAQLPVGASHLDVQAGWERNRRREFEEEAAEAADEVATGLLATTWTADVRLHHPEVGPFTGSVGASVLQNDFEKFGEETLIPNNSSVNFGLFAFEQATVGRFRFSGGIRFDRRSMDVEADDVLGLEAQQRDWNSLVGNVGVLYRLSEPAALVLNVGRGFRAPNPFELYANGVHEGTLAFERGNPDLDTETSLNTDLALRIQGERVALEAGGFLNVIDNYIYTVPVPGLIDEESGLQVYDVTQGNARLSGFEVSLQWHPSRSLHLEGTADYVFGQNTTTDSPLASMPPFRATWRIRYEGPDLATWAFAPYLWVGGETNARQTRLDPAEAEFYAQAFDGVGFSPMGYTLVDIGGGITLGGRTPFALDFRVRNLLDKAYAAQLSRIKTNAPLPGMGRTLTMGVRVEFGG
ncbi:MAG TPA: TonB-dependent receptor [Gemmatimonadales bacterium]|nr:TonB-dependent receptor [Gemmatimonadales bacterium]